ncbi:DUF3822 family protein [Abyssalbus ytuae]|uniref:DUF3822 family protein n=1 Tax=Abyssalbus ytuae TaxID=2926907 RepID=A0A9E6ZQP6_9FLAO|nr:DUF3822 family protein [Abyssalbus ytuae]UOB17028.1 DUF3822 family protein [Abyssalbus ytuae]
MTQNKESNILQNNYKELSIQVSLSGLSFCIINSALRKVEYLKNISFNKLSVPEAILDKLKEHIASENILEQDMNRVVVLHQNELSTFVPKPLFSNNNLSDYLKYNVKILDNDFIAYDEIKNTDLINVYVPYTNINNYIFDKFGEFEYKHFSSVLVETLLNKSQKKETPVMYLNVSVNYFEIVLIKNRQLLLYNTFEFFTKEDFIYYLLFTVEQLELNPEVLTLYLLGDIEKGDELYEITYKYIRNVEFGTNYSIYNVSEDITPPQTHENLILFNSF